MLRKYSTYRTLGDNLRLGSLTAFAAGMVNVASLMIFFSFTSNITGAYAILASEIAKGNPYQIGIVLGWILLFFLGGFVSNLIVVHFNRRNAYLAHATPIVLEILAIVSVGVYGEFFYRETLRETEVLISVLLFAMGLQNGLTASISNFAVKTTHLTGTTTDLGIVAAMFTKEEHRRNPEIRDKAKLLVAIIAAYFTGALCGGYLAFLISFKVFFAVGAFLLVVPLYDLYRLHIAPLFKTATGGLIEPEA